MSPAMKAKLPQPLLTHYCRVPEEENKDAEQEEDAEQEGEVGEKQDKSEEEEEVEDKKIDKDVETDYETDINDTIATLRVDFVWNKKWLFNK